MENQIKELLRRDGIRLWLPPYYNDNVESASDLNELINKYCAEKDWPVESVRECIITLQSYALNRMSANKTFHETGKATVYINFVKPDSNVTNEHDSQSFEIYLCECGKNLCELAGQKFQLPLNYFKLIAVGRVVDDNKTLQEQGINHLSEILCIKLTQDEINSEQQRIWQMSVDQTKNAVNKLASQVQIADQYGNSLHIPEEEKMKGAENEKVLIIRLQLLQGIFFYYNKNYKRAFSLLLEAESGIRQMDVDSEKLSYLIQMGYTDCEARLALRATGGNVERAVQRIIDDREEAEQLKVREQEKGEHRKLQKELGKTANGQWIDLKKYQDLLSLGYSKSVAAEALKQANNNFNSALEILYAKQASGDFTFENCQTNGECAASADVVAKENNDKFETSTSAELSSAAKQLMDMGFVTNILTDVVNRHGGNTASAVSELLQMADSLCQTSAMFPTGNRDQLQNLLTEAVNEALGVKKEDVKDASENAAAWATLQEDIPEELNAHLNVTLEEEEQFLMMYKNLILPHIE